MDVAEYAEQDATDLAQLIKTKQVSADEVHRAALAAIAKVQPDINAACAEPFEKPLDYNASGPFAGVPFGLKDLLCHAEGVTARWGSRILGEDGYVFDSDSELMARFRRAGLATSVLTATPEFGYGGNTESLVNGSTRNPWDLTKSAGGSSGGSAALVAAGGVPVAHANDAGGSIRIPSSYNGTVGLKPSRGLVSLGPGAGEGTGGLASEFVVTRSVRDVAGILDQVAGWTPGERYRVQGASRPYVDELTANPRGLKIAVHTGSWAGSPVDPEVAAGVEAVGATLQSLGHNVELATPVWNWDEVMEAQHTLWIQFSTGMVELSSSLSGIAPSEETLEACNLIAWRTGMTVTAQEFARATAFQNSASRMLGQFFGDYDLLLTPTTNTPAQPLGWHDFNDYSIDANGWVDLFHHYLSFTPPFNLTGVPAMSLPLGQSSAGLPFGVQLVGDMCQESLLIGVAAQLEEATPWSGRRPGIHAAV